MNTHGNVSKIAHPFGGEVGGEASAPPVPPVVVKAVAKTARPN
jgi:hypothetical protein